MNELCIEESKQIPLVLPTAFYPPSQLPASTSAADNEMLAAPVIMTSVTNASVYLTGGRHAVHTNCGQLISADRVSNDHLSAIPWQSHTEVAGTSLLLGNSAGASCYYHWMLDILPKIGFLQKAGRDLNSIDYFLVREIVHPFQLECLAKLGIDQSRIIQTAKQPYLNCEEVLVMNLDHQVNMTMHELVPHWVRDTFSNPQTSTRSNSQEKTENGRRLFITRPANTRRSIENADEVQQHLESQGFECLAMEGLTIEQQSQVLGSADIVVSQHGSALTNMVFAKPKTKIIELFGQHVYPFYYGLANLCGHEYFATLLDSQDYESLTQKNVALTKGSESNVAATQGKAFSVDITVLDQAVQAAMKT